MNLRENLSKLPIEIQAEIATKIPPYHYRERFKNTSYNDTLADYLGYDLAGLDITRIEIYKIGDEYWVLNAHGQLLIVSTKVEVFTTGVEQMTKYEQGLVIIFKDKYWLLDPKNRTYTINNIPIKSAVWDGHNLLAIDKSGTQILNLGDLDSEPLSIPFDKALLIMYGHNCYLRLITDNGQNIGCNYNLHTFSPDDEFKITLEKTYIYNRVMNSRWPSIGMAYAIINDKIMLVDGQCQTNFGIDILCTYRLDFILSTDGIFYLTDFRQNKQPEALNLIPNPFKYYS